MFACKDKIALVTGGLGVIGKAYTKHLLQSDVKGVAIIDLQESNLAYLKELDDTYGAGKCIYITVNVVDASELKGAFEKTAQHFGQLDIVINNAGISDGINDELCLQVNFMAVMRGTMLALREYLPKYKKGSGVIVNTASVAGVVPFPFTVYCITKHAVASIGVCFKNSEECRDQDIRILTLCPGPTTSPVLPVPIKYKDGQSKERTIPNAPSAEYLGEGLIKMTKEGENGDVWMFMEGKQPYKVDYNVLHKDALEYILNR